MTLLFALIFVASRTCANKGDIEADQAVAVARQQIDFRPDGHNVRFMRRGVNQRPFWAVSLWQRGEDGVGYRRITVVLVDAENGNVEETHVARTP
jgi:hypothetical protein